jgi:hypothetical protein
LGVGHLLQLLAASGDWKVLEEHCIAWQEQLTLKLEVSEQGRLEAFLDGCKILVLGEGGFDHGEC